MAFADLHCDTISKVLNARLAGEDCALRDGAGLHSSLKNLRAGGCVLQNFALFVDLSETSDPWGRVLHLAEVLASELERNADLARPVLSFADMERAREEGKLAAVLTVEEGGVCGGDLRRLRTLHRLGARMMTLTWNYENELAAPNGRPGGLTGTGVAFLEEMERLGVIPDVSHLGDDGFWEVCRRAKRPFVASHSSARTLCPHRRNLTDEMLRAIGDRGGLAGVNFYAPFLGESPVTRTEDVVRHLRHMADRAGIDAVALGSDLDGIDCALEIGDAAGMGQLETALRRGGFSERETEKILWKNVWDFYRENLRP